MRGLEPGSFHKMNTSALKWRAEKGRLHGGPQHLMNSAICRLFLDSEKFLEMSFPGWFLLHKSLCFSPWQPHNSRAQLSSDSTNRTPQNTHFSARVFPPSPSSPAKTLPGTALKPNDRTDHEWRHTLGLIRAHMWHSAEDTRRKTWRASGAGWAQALLASQSHDKYSTVGWAAAGYC